jgi:hypothetical protein
MWLKTRQIGFYFLNCIGISQKANFWGPTHGIYFIYQLLKLFYYAAETESS